MIMYYMYMYIYNQSYNIYFDFLMKYFVENVANHDKE